MHPLVRLQFRGMQEKDRKGWIFEKVTDAKGTVYEIPVALGIMAPNRFAYALGMGVNSDRDIVTKWAEAQTHPIPPRIVGSGPCQELVLEGERLQTQGGVGLLPVPISTPGFDCAPFLTSGHWVTKDPETGDLNFGTYRGQIKGPTRIGLSAFEYQDIAKHWIKARAKGKPLEAAIVIGCTPNLSYCASARLSTPEFPVAGGIAGEPVDLLRCKTVDLVVPAYCEIVIEGLIPTDEIEPEGPFGEFTGYMAPRIVDKFLNVTCITRRRDAIFQAFFSQFPPSESSVIRGVGLEGVFYKLLTVDHNMKNITDVVLLESCGSHMVCVIRMNKLSPSEPMTAMRYITDYPRAAPKIVITVDTDINPRDADALLWAMSYRMQPIRDVTTRDVKMSTALDLSMGPPSARSDLRALSGSAILIDATRKWDYPPTSLPKRDYMERAMAIWQELGLPNLSLKDPWFGENLGYWSREDEDDAARAVRGDYYLTGDLRRSQRVKN
jgi:4-hydroxy-3-polyprenylbenzoate decarboxylase